MSGMHRRHAARLRTVQKKLERLYALECGPDVVDFVQIAGDGSREQLLIRQIAGELEIALVLPPLEAAPAGTRPAPRKQGQPSDEWLQVLEGISHFVLVVDRARAGRSTTQLELELQAEVDKFVLLALERRSFGPADARTLHDALYERVHYLHPEESEAGERYRLANKLAARFVLRLLQNDEQERRLELLRRFYRSDQSAKIALARAA